MAVSSALGVSAPKVEPPVQDDCQPGEAGPVQADALEPRAGRTRWLWGEARSTEGGEPRAVAHRVSRRGPPAPRGGAEPERAPRSAPRAGHRAGAAAPPQLAGCPRAAAAQVPAEMTAGDHPSVGSAAARRPSSSTGRRPGGAHLEPVGRRPAGPLEAETPH